MQIVNKLYSDHRLVWKYLAIIKTVIEQTCTNVISLYVYINIMLSTHRCLIFLPLKIDHIIWSNGVIITV